MYSYSYVITINDLILKKRIGIESEKLYKQVKNQIRSMETG